jgi:hypothetical protein
MKAIGASVHAILPYEAQENRGPQREEGYFIDIKG